MLTLRRTRATAWQISAALRLPRSTVTRVLARAGLNRVALLDPPAPVQRYEWPQVGDLLHIDLKRLGSRGWDWPSHPWRSSPPRAECGLGVSACRDR